MSNIHFSLLDHLQLLLSHFHLPCFHVTTPPSPLSGQEAELEGLLSHDPRPRPRFRMTLEEHDEEASTLFDSESGADLHGPVVLKTMFEPSVTLEDLEREEREQAERERAAERAGGLDIYSPPAREEEFGDFIGAGKSVGG